MKLKHNKIYLVLIITMIMIFSITSVGFADDEEITILFTHDMHDHYLPFDLLIDDQSLSIGGYTRLKTAIDEQKQLDPDALLVDAGDFSMGTLFQSIYATDAPQFRLLGLLGYDVVTLGNHEYDFRAEGLAKALDAAIASGDNLPEVVQSNIEYPIDENGNMTNSMTMLKSSMENYDVKDYTVIDKNGIKIGLFGIMGEDSESKAPMAEITFTDPVEKAKEMVEILKNKEKVDIIVCLSHSGVDPDIKKSEDEILAKEVPQIDVIISGHTHTMLKSPITVGNTIIGSVGEYGENLGVIKLIKNNDSWSLKEYNLEQIDKKFAENNEVLNTVDSYKNLVQSKYLDKFNLEFDQVLAYSPFNFTSTTDFAKTHGEDTLGNFISDAYRFAVKNAEGDDSIPIDVAITPSGTVRGSFVKGDITVADVFNVSSLGIGADKVSGYPLISVYMTGKELKTACEVDASISPIMTDAQLFMSGLNFTFNPNRLPLNKVTDVKLVSEDGSLVEPEDEKLYRVAVGLYSAQMLSAVESKSKGILSVIPKDENGAPITDFEARIIKTPDGNEVKEWYAIAQYAQSFEQSNGISIIPDYYNHLQDRKIIDRSKSLSSILGKPNSIALIAYFIVVLLILLIGLLIYKITKFIIRRK